MEWRTKVKLLAFLALIAAYSYLSVGSSKQTLAAVIYDPSEWSIPAYVHSATSILRAEGYEVRLVEIDIENCDGADPAELSGCLIEARKRISEAKRNGDPAAVIAFQTGGRVSVDMVPAGEEDFLRAVR